VSTQAAGSVSEPNTKRSSSIGSILAEINKPKKKRKKTTKANGGMMDQSIARLLREEENEFDKEKAAAAAKAALENMGKLDVEEHVRFAGETIKVSRAVEKSSSAAKAYMAKQDKLKQRSALDELVDEIRAKKKTISTVQKSSYDWEKYKEKEGFGKELEEYAKNGYVDKQEFLHRVDQRQFELERAEREKARAMSAAAAARDKK